MKLKLISFFIIVAFFMVGCCSEEHRGDVQLHSSTNSVKMYMTSPMFPHGTESYRLEVNGISYHNVYGGLFLEIPEKHLVCFRTEPNIGWCYLYVVPTKSDFKAFKIKLDCDSSFGHSLGMDKDDVYSTYVEKIEGDDVYFVENYKFAGERYHYRLNLKLHTLEELK